MPRVACMRRMALALGRWRVCGPPNLSAAARAESCTPHAGRLCAPVTGGEYNRSALGAPQGAAVQGGVRRRVASVRHMRPAAGGCGGGSGRVARSGSAQRQCTVGVMAAPLLWSREAAVLTFSGAVAAGVLCWPGRCVVAAAA